MKPVSQTLTFPGTTVEEVYAMLADPAYRKAVGDYQRVSDFTADIEPTATGMRIRLEQAQITGRVPSFAAKMVGEEIRFVREETWSSHTAADVHVAIPGKPGEITGTTTLAQSGADVVQQIDLAVKVTVPLIGGRLEGLVADFVKGVFDAEHTVGLAWLRGEQRA